jgi:hypothetical protein
VNPFEPPIEGGQAPVSDAQTPFGWKKYGPTASVALFVLGMLIVFRSVVGWPSWIELLLGVGTTSAGFWLGIATQPKRNR